MPCPKCGSASGTHDGRCVTCGHEPTRPPSAAEEAAARRHRTAGATRVEEARHVNTCKASGCQKPVTTAKPSAGYCYSHLVRLAPELCPPSMRPKRRPNVRVPRKEAAARPDGRANLGLGNLRAMKLKLEQEKREVEKKIQAIDTVVRIMGGRR